jgi:hypothetical protein
VTVAFPDGVLRRLHDLYRDRLDDAHRRYSDNRTPETRVAYLKELKAFADLVLRYQHALESEWSPQIARRARLRQHVRHHPVPVRVDPRANQELPSY